MPGGGSEGDGVWQHNTEKTILKLSMGAFILLQAIFLIITSIGWLIAYKNAKRELRRVKQIEFDLQEARRVPQIANHIFQNDPSVDNSHRSRARNHRDEERLQTVAPPNYAAPRNIYPTANIVC